MVGEAQVPEKQAIHGYVCTEIHNGFEAYRREVGLTSGSALLTLLVLREIKVQRLGSAATRAREGSGGVPRDAKVSAYIDAAKFEEFKALTSGLDRSASECAAALIERELKERWLQAALELPLAPEDAA